MKIKLGRELGHIQIFSGTLGRVLRWQYLGLCLLIVTALALHFSTIMQADGWISDEYYYLTEARGVMAGWGPLLTENPPLARLLIVSGIGMFGDNPMGWRFFSVLFGVAGIALFYFICGSLNMRRRAQLLATFLFTLENMSFVRAGIATLDVYMVTFMLGAFLLYLRAKYFTSGFLLGLSALAKLTGALGFLAVSLDWLFARERRLLCLLIVALSALLSFLLLMPLLDYAMSGEWANPSTRVGYMLMEASSLTLSAGHHAGGFPPWDWILRPAAIFYSYDPQYIEMVTPTIWVLIIPSVVYMLVRAMRGSSAARFGLSWFAAAFLPWIPISLVMGRITYLYYFYPAIGAVCLGLSLGLNQVLELRKSQGHTLLGRLALPAVSSYLTVHVALFFILSPVFIPLVRWVPLP